MGNTKSKRKDGVQDENDRGSTNPLDGPSGPHPTKEKQISTSNGTDGGSTPNDAVDEEIKLCSGIRNAKKAKLEDFVLLKTVGRGSFGKVIQVRKKDDGRIYAMKILKKEMILRRKQYEHTLSERRILENIEHPFIVSLRFAFQTEHKLFMVFDFFNGGELYHYLSEGGRFGEVRAKFYAAEIASALGYLHDRGIVYRDLKPENLILDDQGHIRIADFGLSKEGIYDDSITSICGTPEYLAPEILRKRPYGKAVDWWSLGTLTYEMIAGLPPFYDRNRQMMYRKILEARIELAPGMSPEAFDLCTRMLQRDPTKRLGYNGVNELKSHPFFAEINWDALDKRKISPPWKPKVSGETDTSNIAPEFVNEPVAVTPSPANCNLKEHMGATPPSFTDFSFAQESVLNSRDSFCSVGTDASGRKIGGFPIGRDGMVLASTSSSAHQSLGNSQSGSFQSSSHPDSLSHQMTQLQLNENNSDLNQHSTAETNTDQSASSHQPLPSPARPNGSHTAAPGEQSSVNPPKAPTMKSEENQSDESSKNYPAAPTV